MDSIHDIRNELPRREGNSLRSITIHFFFKVYGFISSPFHSEVPIHLFSGDKERRNRIVKRRVRRRPLPQYTYFFLFFSHPLRGDPGVHIKIWGIH
jgi:hypothetical protein